MSQREPPNVGAKVQSIRESLGLSMRGLAELCELSPNTISLIERGVTSPSVATLHRLAGALRVPITAFFEQPVPAAQLIYSRPGERSFSGSNSVLLESLGSGLEGLSIEPFVVTLAPGADSGPGTIIHDRHELVYCMEGTLEYVIEGQTYLLDSGESLLFEARLPHCWRNPLTEPCRFLLVFEGGGQDRRLEQHLQH